MVCFVVVLGGAVSHAALIAKDEFSYADGTNLGGQTGGTGGWTSAWTPTSGATNGDWVISDGVARTVGNDGEDDRFMQRNVNIPSPTTTTLYFSYLYTMPTPAPGEINSNSAIYGGLRVGNAAFGFLTIYSQEFPTAIPPQPYHLRMIGTGGNSVPGPPYNALTYGEEYLIVGRAEPNFNSVPGDTRVTVWIDPTSEASTPALQQVMNSFTWSPNFVSLYRESHNFTSVSYDRVIVATDFLSTVPEPGTLGVVAPIIGLMMRRRR
jgi:hypothetical protein